MRRPWNSSPSPLVGEDYRDSLPSLDRPADREKMQWGAGGLILGGLFGLLAGTKFTFHTPVRRRLHR
jgi:hypothetical protein